MPWTTIALLGVLALWGLLGLMPWFFALIASRGRVALVGLPLTFAVAMGGGALVPALGGKDALGFAISLLVALLAGTIFVVALRQLHVMRKEPS